MGSLTESIARLYKIRQGEWSIWVHTKIVHGPNRATARDRPYPTYGDG